MIFDDSDKKNQEKIDEQNLLNLDLVDFSADLNTSLGMSNLLFNKLNHDEIYSMFETSGIITKLKERGFGDINFVTEYISDLDNRIFVKTNSGEVLVHIRLKVADFLIKPINENRKMIYIDWLLTQNINLKSSIHKKKLFPGQDYPGLNIFNELTKFIFIIYSKLNCYGVFNIPEYFHDAVLFQKRFNFVDPIKEGSFRALQNHFKNLSIRKISNLLHSNQIFFQDTEELFSWFHAEMLSTENTIINDSIFNKKYFEILDKTKEQKFFIKES